MYSNQGDHNKTDRMRLISGFISALSFFFLTFYFFTLTLSHSVSPYLTLRQPVSPPFFFLVAVVTSVLCSVHHRAPCSITDSNILYCHPPTLSPVVNYQNSNRLRYISYFSAFFLVPLATELPLI